MSQIKQENSMYRITHRVLSTFKLVYGHLNGIFLPGNFAWVFSRPFVNSGQKDQTKFLNFDPCTVCGKKVRVSKGVLLPAFWATPPYYSITCFLGHTPYYSYKKNNDCTTDCNLNVNWEQWVPEWLVAQKAQDLKCLIFVKFRVTGIMNIGENSNSNCSQ